MDSQGCGFARARPRCTGALGKCASLFSENPPPPQKKKKEGRSFKKDTPKSSNCPHPGMGISKCFDTSTTTPPPPHKKKKERKKQTPGTNKPPTLRVPTNFQTPSNTCFLVKRPSGRDHRHGSGAHLGRGRRADPRPGGRRPKNKHLVDFKRWNPPPPVLRGEFGKSPNKVVDTL